MLLTVAGFQVPVIPLLEVVGNIGAVAFSQIGAILSNAGLIIITLIVILARVAH